MTGLYIRGDFFTCPNPLSYDPYSKCEYNCVYCFIKQMEKTCLKKNATSDIRTANLHELENQLKRINDDKPTKNPVINALRHLPVIIGRKCEPFCTSEHKLHATLDAVRLFKQYGKQCIIETKDVMDMTDYYDNIEGISISIMPGNKHDLLEPNCPTILTRSMFARQCKEAGLYVGIVGEPIIPTINSSPQDIDQWVTLLRRIEPDHVNFGELRYNSVKYAYEAFNSVGISLLDITHGMQQWKAIGTMIFDKVQEAGLACSSPDWVNFMDKNDCLGCCGLDRFGTHQFNMQTAWQKYTADGKVSWETMKLLNIFNDDQMTEKFKTAFDNNDNKYYTLCDCGAHKTYDENNNTIYTKKKKTLKGGFN